MAEPPLVSIIVPLFNRAHLVSETISSVLSQSYTSLEVIVVDDRSTDGGPDLVKRLSRQDRRCKLLVREGCRGGAPACRNVGLQRSSGDLIVFLDSDDVLAAGCVEQRVSFLETHRDCDFAVSQSLLFKDIPGDSRLMWNRSDFSLGNLRERFLDQDMPFANGGPTWRRSATERVGAWMESLACWQDWHYHLAACTMELKPGLIDKPDFFVRRSDAEKQISKSNNQIAHVQSRLTAIEAAIELLSSRNQLKGTVRRAARGLLLRNYLSIQDAGQPDLAFQLLNLRCARQLLWPTDRLLLQWVRSHGDTWHWNRRVRRVTRFCWRNLKFDYLNMNIDFMSTEWTGEMPKVGLTRCPRD